MNIVKVVRVESDRLVFGNGSVLSSYHRTDCCEHHYLDMGGLSHEDFQGLEFDLEGDFFERVANYGILLRPLVGHPVRIPGYGINNGYYSCDLDLVITNTEGFEKTYDITECQDWRA